MRRIPGPALTILAALAAAGFVASLPSAYRRLVAFDPYLVPHPDAVRAGLAGWGVPPGAYAVAWLTGLCLIAVIFIGVGLLILIRRPDDRAALLCAGVLIAFGGIWPNTVPVPGWPAPLAVATEVVADAAFIGFFGLVFVFPDGRFTPRWTRWACLGLAIHVVVAETGTIPEPLDIGLALVWIGCGVTAQVHRYRRVSTPAQRQQTKWVAAALIAAMTGFGLVAGLQPLPVFSRSGPGALVYNGLTMLAFGGLFCLVPIAIARAVLRRRLWDIDPILNRALLYGTLTAALTAVYAVIVTWAARGVELRGYPVASFLAAAVVTVLVEPLRRRLRGWANRVTYGQREDPYAVVTALARRLEDPDASLPALAASVRRAMRSPYAAIVAPDGSVLAGSGTAVSASVRTPLVQQGEVVGELRVAPRAPGETYDRRDRRLLADLARHSAPAVRAARLHDQVLRSRERLVTAREEERRRLRRDLHDGLGPALAAQTLQVEAAVAVLRDRPEQAEALLAEVLARGAEAVGEVRRIAHGLRPPALDELGLAGAVQVAAGEFAATFPVRVDAAGLPPLPAAVEVAGYAIVREALTNVARHAAAGSARVVLRAGDGALLIDVIDDGRGPGTGPAGVGTVSMRERARELGGSCEISGRPGGGTTVSARLPLPVVASPAALAPASVAVADQEGVWS
ncbi:sensor histidine kinase [Actinoplanes awajinensis]|uniref:Histidine kinase/HSP90-like ATPase domain-containing protein n=1 Tax=Actinoplanes awajinensis subsp. mycoplanecinus TaxID=135947 RepID=A0A124G937_9ACTN|nr:sensor histidine kinase [Actinoplanes awajinensis]KUL27927.1 hypothetical protein ADL15_33145 [Actinoplanes awajinensis subsp. mycoplanecinus]